MGLCGSKASKLAWWNAYHLGSPQRSCCGACPIDGRHQGPPSPKDNQPGSTVRGPSRPFVADGSSSDRPHRGGIAQIPRGEGNRVTPQRGQPEDVFLQLTAASLDGALLERDRELQP